MPFLPWSTTTSVSEHECGQHRRGEGVDRGLRGTVGFARHQLQGAPRGNFHDSGRIGFRQKHAAEKHDRTLLRDGGRGLYWRGRHRRCARRRARTHPAQVRRDVSGRRFVRVDELGKQCGFALGGMDATFRRCTGALGALETATSRTRRVRQLSSFGNQRRHAEARRRGTDHGPRPGASLSRRAFFGTRSGHFRRTRRSHPFAFAQSRDHLRYRQPRTLEHPGHRRPRDHAGRRRDRRGG